MKSLKTLYEENESKGGFWVKNKEGCKSYIHGMKPNSDEFVGESKDGYLSTMNPTHENYEFSKAGIKMLAFIEKSSGQVILVKETEITSERAASFDRASWLDGEIE